MLNKVLVAKFVTAMTLAGFATGAAAGFDLDDPADDGDRIELEAPLPLEDDESTTSDDETTEDSDDGDTEGDNTEGDNTEGDEADDDADVADDEGSKPEKDADQSKDEDAVKEPKAPTHGSIVSECARSTELSGRDKGQAVSTVAKDDTAECAAPAEEDEASVDESESDLEDEADEKPRAAKAQGAEHRNEKAGEKLVERDARKADR